MKTTLIDNKLNELKAALFSYIEEQRNQKGFSQIEMAKRCGMNPASYSNCKNGHFKKIGLDTLVRLNMAINTRLNVDDLIK